MIRRDLDAVLAQLEAASRAFNSDAVQAQLDAASRVFNSDAVQAQLDAASRVFNSDAVQAQLDAASRVLNSDAVQPQLDALQTQLEAASQVLNSDTVLAQLEAATRGLDLDALQAQLEAATRGLDLDALQAQLEAATRRLDLDAVQAATRGLHPGAASRVLGRDLDALQAQLGNATSQPGGLTQHERSDRTAASHNAEPDSVALPVPADARKRLKLWKVLKSVMDVLNVLDTMRRLEVLDSVGEVVSNKLLALGLVIVQATVPSPPGPPSLSGPEALTPTKIADDDISGGRVGRPADGEETNAAAYTFAPLIPNAVTIEAMKEARKGSLPRFTSVQALLDDLHAHD